MRRFLIEWGTLRVPSYPAFLYLGFVLGIAGQNWAANVAGLDSATVYVAAVTLIPVGLAGSRLLFVASHWPLYRGDPRRIWRRSEGGMSMYGGLVSMLLLSLPLLSWLEVPFWSFWDVSIFCILIGMCSARVGCLLNGCCAGRPSRGLLAMHLPDERGVWARRWPTQLLEAGLGLSLLVAAAAIGPASAKPGVLFLFVAGVYGLGRLALEPTRARRDRIGRLDLQLIISAALVILAGVGMTLIR